MPFTCRVAIEGVELVPHCRSDLVTCQPLQMQTLACDAFALLMHRAEHTALVFAQRSTSQWESSMSKT